MSFWSERDVRKPQKEYKCYACGEIIEGKHKYISAKQNGEFFTIRLHSECLDKVYKMCSECEYNDDCQEDIATCFLEKITKGGDK